MKKNTFLITIMFFALAPVSVFGQELQNKKDFRMENTVQRYGIEGQSAPELQVSQWIDGDGNEMKDVRLADYKGKFKMIYCFQAWCPGCHSSGLPSLQKMVEALKDSDKVAFMAIQTVFEGAHANTFERMTKIQDDYGLKIPFGHDTGDASTRNISSTMHNYKTGGTPWFILIDEKNQIIFNDFRLNTEKAIEYLLFL
jgi:hypothetical protein